MRLYTFIGLCGLAVALQACAREAAGSRGPAAVSGAQVFEQACAKCHGADGSGGLPTVANGPKPIDLRSADWQRSRTDAEIGAAIRDGRGAMPPFADVLSPDQIGALTAHVRHLATARSR